MEDMPPCHIVWTELNWWYYSLQKNHDSLFLPRGACKAKIVSHLLMLLQFFFYQYFCLKIFFFQFCFSIKGFTLDASPLTQQSGFFMYLCYEKYGMQQAVEIGLSSRVMCIILVFGSYCTLYTRREKSNFFPSLRNLLFWSSVKHNI